MADLLKRNTVIGVEEEVTEGTYVAPAAATSFVQPLVDGFEQSGTRELIERDVLTGSIGKVSPLAGERGVTGSLPVEMRGSGTEGEKPDFDKLLEGALGQSRQIAAQVTTKTGNGVSQLEIQDADIGDFAVGDGLVILESGAHHICVVTAVDPTGGTANITILPAASGAFSDNVVISKTTTYFPANADHPSLSLSYYLGNGKNQRATGAKINSMSLDGFTVGQVASWNFGFEGLKSDEVNEAAPFTPTYDSETPPLILSACVYQDGTQVDVNNFAFSLTNTVSFKRSTCSADGKLSSLISQREVSGSFDPFMGDSETTQFDNFDNNTAYSLFASAYNPSSTAGEVDLGSVVTIYLPNVITTEKPAGDIDELFVHNVSFSANRGESGSSDEIFVSVI